MASTRTTVSLPGALAGALVLVLATPFAAAQERCNGGAHRELYRFWGDVDFGDVGHAVAGVGDMDGDGIPDFAVGGPGYAPGAGLPVAGVVWVFQGSNGVTLIHRLVGGTNFDDFGYAVASAGDVNLDGTPDLIVGAPGADPRGVSSAGEAYVYSGATGLLVYTFFGTHVDERFGETVAGVGDVDGDGHPDVAVGAPSGQNAAGTVAGTATVYSGANGQPIHHFAGIQSQQELGVALAGAGDVDGDGHDDVLIGSPEYGIGGAVGLFSGATGALIGSFRTSVPDARFGAAVSGVDDLDGDGVRDVLVGAPALGTPLVGERGAAFVFSAATGDLIHRFDGVYATDSMGSSVSGAGDVDGDGIGDLLVGAVGSSVGGADFGAAYVFSGAGGTMIRRMHDGLTTGQFGFAVAGGGDMNGDGLSEVIVGAPHNQPYGGTHEGAARVYTIELFLRAGQNEVSASAGGTLRFSLDFPVTEAAQAYALRGSMTGSGPWDVGGSCLPLTPDGLTEAMAQAGAGVFGEASGTLNLAGDKQVQISVPAGHPAMSNLVGRRLWFAAFTFDAGPQLREKSAAITVRIVP